MNEYKLRVKKFREESVLGGTERNGANSTARAVKQRGGMAIV